MRYELADYEWIAIKPMLPNKPRGVPRVNDRRVLNGIFWVLRSGAPWRDLPEMFGPYTTCYNRFVRWRRAGVWGRVIDALAAAHDAAVQMIDTSIVRVHQHGACITRNRRQSMGRSGGSLGQPTLDYAPNHRLSTFGRQRRILVDVHRVSPWNTQLPRFRPDGQPPDRPHLDLVCADDARSRFYFAWGCFRSFGRVLGRSNARRDRPRSASGRGSACPPDRTG